MQMKMFSISFDIFGSTDMRHTLSLIHFIILIFDARERKRKIKRTKKYAHKSTEKIDGVRKEKWPFANDKFICIMQFGEIEQEKRTFLHYPLPIMYTAYITILNKYLLFLMLGALDSSFFQTVVCTFPFIHSSLSISLRLVSFNL